MKRQKGPKRSQEIAQIADATAVHNHYENATTKVAPIEALLGYLPRLDYSGPPSMNERAEERTITAHQKRVQAKEAINRWAGKQPEARLHAGDRVWLEGKNLKLPYQNLKLAPKRYGPFKISRVISPVAYQLDLPRHGRYITSSTPAFCPRIKRRNNTEPTSRDLPQTSLMEKKNTRSRPSEIIATLGDGELSNT